MKKKAITVLAAAFMCISTTVPAFAASSSFSYVDVDSNYLWNCYKCKKNNF